MENERNGLLQRVLRTMDRRTLLGRGAAVAGAAFAGLSVRSGRAYGQPVKPTAEGEGGDNTWNVVDLSGEKPTRMREYGAGAHRILDGRPLMASGATARKILERIQKLSAPYGTRVEIEDGVGVVRVS